MARIFWVLLALSACTSDSRDFDPYPIAIDVGAGPIMVAVSDGAGGVPVPAIIDTLTPISVLDSFEPGVALSEPRRREIDLQLYSGTAVARALFQNATIVDMHPCAGATAGAEQACRVGTGTDLRTLAGIVGTDLLGRGALRVDFSTSTMWLFPEIAGDDDARGRACEAVLRSPFAGGGTLLIAGAELGYAGRRTAVGTCAAFSPDAAAEIDRGLDMMFVVSTGIGPTVLARSSYARYRAYCATHSCTEPAPLESLPETVIYLPSGPIAGRVASVERLGLVGEGSTERGPCKELYANHVMSVGDCNDDSRPAPVSPCPCADGAPFCTTAAVVELSGAFDVVILPDDSALLQSLRFELRPDLPEIDGLIGTQALARLALDFDYPNNRLVARCTDDTTCLARPAVRGRASLGEIANCPNLP